MANNKKSFTAYCDWIEIFEELTDNEAGKLVKHLLRYVNDLNPEAPDRVTKLTFTPIKNTLKRDLKKWQEKREKNRENARKRWDKKDATACDRIKNDANNAVSVSVSVSDINNNSAEVKTSTPQIDFKKLLDFINLKTKRTGKDKFRIINDSVKRKYKARLKDGYTNLDIANAIENAVIDNYHKETNFKYLTPEFFSRADKIDKHGFKSKNKKITLEEFSSNAYDNF